MEHAYIAFYSNNVTDADSFATDLLADRNPFLTLELRLTTKVRFTSEPVFVKFMETSVCDEDQPTLDFTTTETKWTGDEKWGFFYDKLLKFAPKDGQVLVMEGHNVELAFGDDDLSLNPRFSSLDSQTSV
jgi:hypothetical protein